MTHTRRNIELKSRCSDLDAVRRRAEVLGARDAGMLRQRDTFFTARHARLKLRDFGDGRAELISYVRPDTAEARGSDYVICPVAQPDQLAAVLTHALGASGNAARRTSPEVGLKVFCASSAAAPIQVGMCKRIAVVFGTVLAVMLAARVRQLAG